MNTFTNIGITQIINKPVSRRLVKRKFNKFIDMCSKTVVTPSKRFCVLIYPPIYQSFCFSSRNNQNFSHVDDIQHNVEISSSQANTVIFFSKKEKEDNLLV